MYHLARRNSMSLINKFVLMTTSTYCHKFAFYLNKSIQFSEIEIETYQSRITVYRNSYLFVMCLSLYYNWLILKWLYFHSVKLSGSFGPYKEDEITYRFHISHSTVHTISKSFSHQTKVEEESEISRCSFDPQTK